MQDSASFVSASALGLACGPALAGLLQTRFKIYKLTFNQNTLPGMVMAIAWLMYLVWLAISFVEPVLESAEIHSSSNTMILRTLVISRCESRERHQIAIAYYIRKDRRLG
ncbi:hypothetical protein Bca52824_011752 [Brassica carinata]|uniref:Uncharacterized protein n=1 Tax=Brassica carinata TaxID=52824 RepID=A0A8X7VV90_BRACI|nr:hypothetical protein Bca52824_011752 [Brassica carinata]